MKLQSSKFTIPKPEAAIPNKGKSTKVTPKCRQSRECRPSRYLSLQEEECRDTEEHKSMCYNLSVHVLPFLRFYRGAYGRLCSFSCTNATINKFKEALAKHTPDRCSLGPTKGLEEKELLALSANKDLSFTYTTKPVQPEHAPAHEELAAEAAHAPPSSESLPLHPLIPNSEVSKERTLTTAGK